jgi:hypothetical protein
MYEIHEYKNLFLERDEMASHPKNSIMNFSGSFIIATQLLTICTMVSSQII